MLPNIWIVTWSYQTLEFWLYFFQTLEFWPYSSKQWNSDLIPSKTGILTLFFQTLELSPDPFKTGIQTFFLPDTRNMTLFFPNFKILTLFLLNIRNLTLSFRTLELWPYSFKHWNFDLIYSKHWNCISSKPWNSYLIRHNTGILTLFLPNIGICWLYFF